MQEVYLYQTVHILGGRSLHLTAHLAVLDRWSRELFGRPAGFRQQSLARQIEALAAQTAPADCDLSQFVRIVVPASGDPSGTAEPSRPFRRPVRSRETLPSYYRVTRSSQRTIDSMTSIDSPQAATKTNHVAHIGVCR